MPTSTRSSNASARFRPGASAPVCRIHWRGSRGLACALALLGLSAPLATLASGCPISIAAPVSLLAVLQGARLARRELTRPAVWLSIPGNHAPATLDGIEMRDLRLRWRGPLACLEWREPSGRSRRLHGWPDVLDAAARRELRLACEARRHAGSGD